MANFIHTNNNFRLHDICILNSVAFIVVHLCRFCLIRYDRPTDRSFRCTLSFYYHFVFMYNSFSCSDGFMPVSCLIDTYQSGMIVHNVVEAEAAAPTRTTSASVVTSFKTGRFKTIEVLSSFPFILVGMTLLLVTDFRLSLLFFLSATEQKARSVCGFMSNRHTKIVKWARDIENEKEFRCMNT